jgi:hypothetical protein
VSLFNVAVPVTQAMEKMNVPGHLRDGDVVTSYR